VLVARPLDESLQEVPMVLLVMIAVVTAMLLLTAIVLGSPPTVPH